jgi:hypothetical protein
VTSPSAVARHGTIAGIQLRCARLRLPTASGLKSRERAASDAVGQIPVLASWRILSGGFHTVRACLYS